MFGQFLKLFSWKHFMNFSLKHLYSPKWSSSCPCQRAQQEALGPKVYGRGHDSGARDSELLSLILGHPGINTFFMSSLWVKWTFLSPDFELGHVTFVSQWPVPRNNKTLFLNLELKKPQFIPFPLLQLSIAVGKTEPGSLLKFWHSTVIQITNSTVSGGFSPH